MTLKPGETRRVTLTAEPRVIADYDTRLPGWRIAPDEYRVGDRPDATDRTMMREGSRTGATMTP